jgi:ferredoxin-NADP reductase
VAEVKSGRVASWERLSDILAILRLAPAAGSRFPDYKPGQYIALRRENCRLTRKVVDADGRTHYVTDVGADGAPKYGPVTHSYSISSAPFETVRDGHLEFYVVLERDEEGPGRLTESLFAMDPADEEYVRYYDRIAGDFTLDKRSAGFESVLFVGTGTGLAPFVSMLKQLDHEAGSSARPPVRYTLVHANRTRAELAYHEELSAIAAAGKLDLLYVASVSRPGPADVADAALGLGRANNLLRHALGMPLKEEDDLGAAAGPERGAAQKALASAVKPRLPAPVTPEGLRERLDPARTVVLTCGNPSAMSDIKVIAERLKMRFEKEDWKPSMRGA